MALSCNREAFKPGDGCPEINVDLTFPDFGACEDADPGRLKGVSRIDLQKSPAFPMFMPAEDPLPVSIPDIDVDWECPFDGMSSGGNDINIDAGHAVASGSVKIDVGDNCSVSGVSIDLDIPDYAGPAVQVSNGAVFYTFSTSIGGWI